MTLCQGFHRHPLRLNKVKGNQAFPVPMKMKYAYDKEIDSTNLQSTINASNIFYLQDN